LGNRKKNGDKMAAPTGGFSPRTAKNTEKGQGTKGNKKKLLKCNPERWGVRPIRGYGRTTTSEGNSERRTIVKR